MVEGTRGGRKGVGRRIQTTVRPRLGSHGPSTNFSGCLLLVQRDVVNFPSPEAPTPWARLQIALMALFLRLFLAQGSMNCSFERISLTARFWPAYLWKWTGGLRVPIFPNCSHEIVVGFLPCQGVARSEKSLAPGHRSVGDLPSLVALMTLPVLRPSLPLLAPMTLPDGEAIVPCGVVCGQPLPVAWEELTWGQKLCFDMLVAVGACCCGCYWFPIVGCWLC